MATRMYRYVVGLDGPMPFLLSHNPVAVATTDDSNAVEFWAEHAEDAPTVKRWFQVFGTGHALPEGARWIGTCPRTSLGLVWHLYEVRP